MPRTWISVPTWRGIRIGRSIADSELRGHLPSWRRYELRHGLQEAAKARGETLTREDTDYIVDKALATGAIDSNGNLNFHMRGTRDEIINGMMATAKAWGSPLSQAEAGSIADKEIRRQWWMRFMLRGFGVSLIIIGWVVALLAP
jgi:hypothetical protein